MELQAAKRDVVRLAQLILLAVSECEPSSRFTDFDSVTLYSLIGNSSDCINLKAIPKDDLKKLVELENSNRQSYDHLYQILNNIELISGTLFFRDFIRLGRKFENLLLNSSEMFSKSQKPNFEDLKDQYLDIFDHLYSFFRSFILEILRFSVHIKEIKASLRKEDLPEAASAIENTVSKLLDLECFSFDKSFSEALSKVTAGIRSNWEFIEANDVIEIIKFKGMLNDILPICLNLNDAAGMDTLQEIVLKRFEKIKNLPSFSRIVGMAEEYSKHITSFVVAFDASFQSDKQVLISEFTHYLDKSWNIFKKGYTYVPVVSNAQSSGSGKSKLCFECLKRRPGFYVSFASPGFNSYPLRSSWADYMIHEISSKDVDFISDPDVPAHQSNVGSFLLLLYRIIVAYFDQLEKYQRLVKGSNLAADDDLALKCSIASIAERFVEDVEWVRFIRSVEITENWSLQQAAQAITTILEQKMTRANFQDRPFILVLDESTNLLYSEADTKGPDVGVESVTDKNAVGGKNKKLEPFRVIRRGLSYLAISCPLIVVTVATNSNIVDLNKPPSNDSDRDSKRRNGLPPYVLLGNFDILPIEYSKIDISEETLCSPDMYAVIASMGRPLWPATRLDRVFELSLRKLQNGSWPESPNPHMAMWAIRTGLPISPYSDLGKYLVKSFMATLFQVSNDLSDIRIYYPSEPILAIAARQSISGYTVKTKNDPERSHHVQKSFEMLFYSIKQRWIDRGNVAEMMAAHILLIYLSDCRALPVNEVKIPQLSENYRNCGFLLQGLDNPQPEQDVPTSMYHDPSYKVHRVRDFLKSFCSDSDLWDGRLLPKIFDGVINATHFVHLDRYFPAEALVPDDKTFRKNLAWRNVIDRGLLKGGLLRQCGFIMPPNYPDFDMIIPVCLPSDTLPGHSIYTFIPVQVKVTAPSSVHCKTFRTTRHYFNLKREPKAVQSIIEQNQVAIMMCFQRDSRNQLLAMPARRNSVGQRSFAVRVDNGMHLFYAHDLSAYQSDRLNGSHEIIRNILNCGNCIFSKNLGEYASDEGQEESNVLEKMLTDNEAKVASRNLNAYASKSLASAPLKFISADSFVRSQAELPSLIPMSAVLKELVGLPEQLAQDSIESIKNVVIAAKSSELLVPVEFHKYLVDESISAMQL